MDNGYQTLGAHYIRRQAKQLARQLDGVRAAEEIEFVHRARVATRRLRAALRMLDDCFGAKNTRRWQKAIRRVTSALGDARDRDVQIELLCGTLSALTIKECFLGIARVLAYLERDRERVQGRVVKAIDRLEAKGVLQKMRRAAKRVPGETEFSGERLQTPETMARIRRHVGGLIDELLEQQVSLDDPEARDRHHAMRIAAKRLRYALEISRPVCPEQLDASIEAIKKVQTLLGDVHDCDVWFEQLDAFAHDERERLVAKICGPERFQRLRPGIDYLRQDRQAYRQMTFQTLVEYWNDLGPRRFWDELKALLATPARRENIVDGANALETVSLAAASPARVVSDETDSQPMQQFLSPPDALQTSQGESHAASAAEDAATPNGNGAKGMQWPKPLSVLRP
jgi:CHAD domain-containing protein